MSLPTNNMIKNEDGFIPDNSGGKMSFNDFHRVALINIFHNHF
jgi:hypothetical protein